MKSLQELIAEIQSSWGTLTPEQLAAHEAEARRQRIASERMATANRLDDSGAASVITRKDYLELLDGVLSQETPALTAVSRFAEATQSANGSTRFLALLGDPGVGKSVACAWLSSKRGGLFIAAEKFSRTYAAGYDDAQVRFESWLRSGLLVVDDLGTEKNAEHAEGAVFRAVNERQNVGLTVFTSNLSRKAFEERYGARTIRRIQHQGKIVVLGGSDLRVKR